MVSEEGYPGAIMAMCKELGPAFGVLTKAYISLIIYMYMN